MTINWPAIYEALWGKHGFSDCRRLREVAPGIWLLYTPGCHRAKRIRVFGGRAWEWSS